MIEFNVEGVLNIEFEGQTIALGISFIIKEDSFAAAMETVKRMNDVLNITVYSISELED